MMSDMALEIIGDFSIVWFLSPAICLTSGSSSAFGSWTAALPGSALQARGPPMYLMRSGTYHRLCITSVRVGTRQIGFCAGLELQLILAGAVIDKAVRG